MLTIEDFVVVVYCFVDDLLKELLHGRRLRSRGFAPLLSDSEVITMLVVGEFLGLDTDKAIWQYFRRHWRAWFPDLGSRSNFVRHGANLWNVLEQLQRNLSIALGALDDPIHIVDGIPMPICRLTRAWRCCKFRGEAALSYCAAKDEFYYGFKGHLLITADGVITAFTVTAANVDEREASLELLDQVHGWLLGDKGYISAFFKSLLFEQDVRLETPLRHNMKDSRTPEERHALGTLRRRIETVIGQLTERFHLAKVRARDVWHLTARVARKLLAHTIGIALNRPLGQEPLQLDELLAA